MKSEDPTDRNGADSLEPATLLARAGRVAGPHGGTAPAIMPSTTFARDGRYELETPEYSYARSGSPAWRPVETLLAELEHGFDCRLYGGLPGPEAG